MRTPHPLSPVPLLFDPHAADRARIDASGLIRNYSTTGEPLTLAQSLWLGPRPLGQQVPMTDPSTDLLKHHGPDGLIETSNNAFPAQALRGQSRRARSTQSVWWWAPGPSGAVRSRGSAISIVQPSRPVSAPTRSSWPT